MTGQIIAYVGTSAPAGFLLCNGATFNVADHPVLAGLLNAVGGTFTTPDLRGRFLIGANGTYVLLTTGGAATKTLATSEIPSHSHDLNGLNNGAVQSSATGSIIEDTQTKHTTGSLPIVPAPIGNTGGGAAFSILPPWYGINYIIEADSV